MKITRKQLRRIIREASGDFRTVSDEEFEYTSLAAYRGGLRDLVPLDPKRPWGSYAEKKDDYYGDTIVMSPHGDSVLVDGLETYIQDVPSQLHHASGFEMSDTDADNLIFELETQEQDGYVELGVEYKDGKWSW